MAVVDRSTFPDHISQILLYFPTQMVSLAQIPLPGTVVTSGIHLLRNNTGFAAL